MTTATRKRLEVRTAVPSDVRGIQRLIARVPGLADVTSSFSMEQLKHSTALPRTD